MGQIRGSLQTYGPTLHLAETQLGVDIGRILTLGHGSDLQASGMLGQHTLQGWSCCRGLTRTHKQRHLLRNQCGQKPPQSHAVRIMEWCQDDQLLNGLIGDDLLKLSQEAVLKVVPDGRGTTLRWLEQPWCLLPHVLDPPACRVSHIPSVQQPINELSNCHEGIPACRAVGRELVLSEQLASGSIALPAQVATAHQEPTTGGTSE